MRHNACQCFLTRYCNDCNENEVNHIIHPLPSSAPLSTFSWTASSTLQHNFMCLPYVILKECWRLHRPYSLHLLCIVVSCQFSAHKTIHSAVSLSAQRHKPTSDELEQGAEVPVSQILLTFHNNVVHAQKRLYCLRKLKTKAKFWN